MKVSDIAVFLHLTQKPGFCFSSQLSYITDQSVTSMVNFMVTPCYVEYHHHEPQFGFPFLSGFNGNRNAFKLKEFKELCTKEGRITMTS